MTNTNGGDRLNKIETALERVASLFQQQGQINEQIIQQQSKTQVQIEQLQSEMRMVLAGIEQLHQIVVRRDNGGQQP